MKSILLTLLLFFSSSVYSQVTVYATYEDFVNQKGVQYDDYASCGHVLGKMFIKLLKDGEKHKIVCDEKTWGFVYKESLFRVAANLKQPVRLMSQGRICYYENGAAHLFMLKNGRSSGEVTGGVSFFSANINSEVVVYQGTDERSESGKLFKSDSDFKMLADCLKKYMSVDSVRDCVSNFEKAQDE